MAPASPVPPPCRPPLSARARLRYAADIAAWAVSTPGDLRLTRRLRLPAPYRRVYLVHVQKTGGTSLERAFYELGGEDPQVVERQFRGQLTRRSGPYVFSITPDPFFIRHAGYFFASSHVPYWSYRLAPGTFTVTMLRDPFARALSRYRHLRDPGADEGHLFPAGPHERAWADGTFAEFLDRFPQDQLLAQLWMFSPAFDPAEAAERIRSMSLWFCNESYEAGVRALADAIRQPLRVRRDRVSRPGEPLSEADAKLLRERLDPEYRLLELLRADPGPGLVGSIPSGS